MVVSTGITPFSIDVLMISVMSVRVANPRARDPKRFEKIIRNIEAIGIGAADSSLPTETQRRALSRDASIVKAQYEMLSMVKGVEIEGGITVSRAIEKDSTLEAKLKEVIKGAEIVKTEFTKDDGAVTTLRLPKKRLEAMMGVRFK